MIRLYPLVAILYMFYSLCNGELECYMGHSYGLMAQHLESKECAHTHQYQLEVKHGTETETHNITYSYHGNKNGVYEDIEYCIIFVHMPDKADETLAGDTEHEKTHQKADFFCDYDYMCKTQDSINDVQNNIYYKGTYGALYCCNSSHCNDRTVVNTMKVPHIACMEGHNETEIIASNCWSPSCRHETIGNSTSYMCDREHYCHYNNVPDNTCVDVTEADNTTRQICCCNDHFCNHPNPTNLTTPFHINIDLPITPMTPIDKPRNPIGVSSSMNYIFVAGVVAAICFALLVFIVVAVIIMRYRKPRRETESFTYSQLTAELAQEQREYTDETVVRA